MKKSRTLKALRNITLSIVGLLIIVVGAGAAYTWYMGKNMPVGTIAATDSTKAIHAEPVIKHVERAANAKIGASVQTLTSPVEPGANASITVKTSPGSTCTISVIYNNEASRDSGLGPRVADDFGVVVWSWTVEGSTPIGKWPVKVTCVLDDFSAVVQADLEVALLE